MNDGPLFLQSGAQNNVEDLFGICGSFLIKQKRKPKCITLSSKPVWTQNNRNLGASTSLAWMQREPGAWWTGAANAHTSQQPPLVLKDGGHLGRISCVGRKSVEFLQTSFLWLVTRDCEVDISPTAPTSGTGRLLKVLYWLEWLTAVKKTLVGSFVRYLQDTGIPIPPYSDLEASQLLNQKWVDSTRYYRLAFAILLKPKCEVQIVVVGSRGCIRFVLMLLLCKACKRWQHIVECPWHLLSDFFLDRAFL